MRVGQLARKLGISPTELINFLASAGIQTAEASNTKLAADQLQVAIKHFDPAGTLESTWKVQSRQEEIPEEVAVVPEDSATTEDIIPVDIEPAVEAAPTADQTESVENTVVEEKIDVIKAPKVELAGLKVLGKIELPEKKKKEPPVENVSADTETSTPSAEQTRQPRRDTRNRNPRHQGSRNDREASRKNPITLKREQEAAEAERKRREEAKLEKERRTQHYLSKVKSVPTKPARLIEEDVVELHADQSKTPTTWLGKFWKWFRS